MKPFDLDSLADITPEQVQIGIAICAQTYEETLEQFLTGQWPQVFARWQRQLRGGWFRRRRITKAALIEGQELFRAYLEDGYQKVPLWKYQTKKGIHLSAPWEMVLKNRLIMAGQSETEVLNGYLPAKWYDYYTVLEIDAAQRCTDDKKWRRVFYTHEDHMRLMRKDDHGAQS